MKARIRAPDRPGAKGLRTGDQEIAGADQDDRLEDPQPDGLDQVRELAGLRRGQAGQVDLDAIDARSCSKPA